MVALVLLNHLFQKRVINFNPIKNKGNKFGEFTKEFTIDAKTNKQVLNEILSKKFKNNQAKLEKVNNRMMFLDKTLSSQKIVKVWESLIPKNYIFSINNHLKIKIILFFHDFINYYITSAILLLKRKYYLKKLFSINFLECMMLQ